MAGPELLDGAARGPIFCPRDSGSVVPVFLHGARQMKDGRLTWLFSLLNVSYSFVEN